MRGVNDTFIVKVFVFQIIQCWLIIIKLNICKHSPNLFLSLSSPYRVSLNKNNIYYRNAVTLIL